VNGPDTGGASTAVLLDDAIHRRRGGESVDAILADQPDGAEGAAELRPLLELASMVSVLAPAPDPERSLAKARVGAAIMDAAQQRWAPHAQAAPGGGLLGWLLRPAGFAAAAASAILALGGGGALVASASSLPGEPLYTVKLAVEEARASVASASGDHSAQAALQAELAQRRLDEALTLIDRQQPLPPGVLAAANHHAEKAEAAAARIPEAKRARVVPTLTASQDQRTDTLSRLLTSGDLPPPAQTAIAGALEQGRDGAARSQGNQGNQGRGQAPSDTTAPGVAGQPRAGEPPARPDEDRRAPPAERQNERDERDKRGENSGAGQQDNRGQDNRATGPSSGRETPVIPPVVLQRPAAAGEQGRAPGNSGNGNGSGRGVSSTPGRGGR
jgi:hypothetical protein